MLFKKVKCDYQSEKYLPKSGHIEENVRTSLGNSVVWIKRWTQPKSISGSSISHQTLLNKRLYIDNHMLKIITRVTKPKIIYWKSSFENHHSRIIPQLLRVTKTRIIHQQLYIENHHENYQNPGLSIANHLLRIIIENHQPRLIYQGSYFKNY